MSKKIFLAVILIMLSHVCVAQDKNTLHAIVMASTLDTSIGPAAEKSRVRFITFLHTIAKEIGYKFDEISLSGYDCKHDVLMETLNDFKCDTSDIVVFCYFGHGTRAEEDESEFPQMCFYGESQSKYIPLEKVKNILAKHGARITWVIGDCCNSYGEWVDPKSTDAEPQSMTVTYGAVTNLYPKMFKEFTGVITMCASKKGTYGWSRNDKGMLFNNALIDFINNVSINDIIPGESWKSVMNRIQIYFSNYPIVSNKYPGKTFYMIPQYIIEPRQFSGGKGKVVTPKLERTLEDALRALYDNKVNWLDRGRRVDGVMRNHFASNAKVRKLTSSGVPYWFGSVKEYLESIARSEIIANIVIYNAKRDQEGKITYMDVIEVNYELK